MKRFIAASSLIFISAFGLPFNALASETSNIQQRIYSQQSSHSQENRGLDTQRVPQIEGVAVVIPQNVIFDANLGQESPLTLALAQPIVDTEGNVLAPTNSLLNAKIVPSNNGGQIVTETLMVNGQVISLRAYSSVLPSTTVTVNDGYASAEISANNLGRTGMAFGCAVESFSGEECNSNSMRTGGSIGLVLGLMTNRPEPETREIVQIPQGTLLVLTIR